MGVFAFFVLNDRKFFKGLLMPRKNSRIKSISHAQKKQKKKKQKKKRKKKIKTSFFGLACPRNRTWICSATTSCTNRYTRQATMHKPHLFSLYPSSEAKILVFVLKSKLFFQFQDLYHGPYVILLSSWTTCMPIR